MELDGVELRTPRGRCPRGRRARQGPDGPMSRSSTPVAPARGCACPPRCAGTPCRPAPAAAAGGPPASCPCRSADGRVSPTSAIIGMPAFLASTRAVTRLVAPGPSVAVADSHPAGHARIAVGHERAAALVVHEVVLEPRVVDRRVERQQLESPHPEDRPGLVGAAASAPAPRRPRARAVPPRRPVRGWQARSQRGPRPESGNCHSIVE